MSSLSCLYGDNAEFVEEMYSRYLQGDKSIGEDWNRIFSSNLEVNKAETCGAQHVTKVDDSVANFFRSYGHFFADLNPLSPNVNKEVDYQKYSNLYPASDAGIYRDIYCKNIGFEFMHISSYEERMWLQEKIENQTYTLSSQDKKEILRHLIESEMFEQFLHMKFPGARFQTVISDYKVVTLMDKKIYYSSLIVQNLKDYILYTANLSEWEVHDEFDNIIFTINGTRESLFNFVFCGDQCTELSIQKTLDYLRTRDIEATLVINSHMKIRDILEKCEIKHVSTPKKALLNMKNYFLPADVIPNLRLNAVNGSNLLEQLDLHTSKIFYHGVGIVSTFFRGLSNYDDKNSRLRFFLVTLNNEIIGTCGLYVQDSVAGFYSDGVLPIYRNRGIGTQMVLERIKIAKQLECKYIVAHCMKSSVNLYKRLGFQMLGNLYLYTSSA